MKMIQRYETLRMYTWPVEVVSVRVLHPAGSIHFVFKLFCIASLVLEWGVGDEV
jgi:hypothetical protein